MCGIVGAVAERNVVPILIEGLKRLEYRGYDSAGVAVIDERKQMRCQKAVGKVSVLANEVLDSNIRGKVGIAHTRWATHGEPSVVNAHPHLSHGQIALVHNGIIENYAELKQMLVNKGYVFQSQTDSEVIAHLLHSMWLEHLSLLQNIQQMVKHLKGAYGLAVMHQSYPDMLVAVRSGSPIVVGYGIGENFISSDTLSLLPVTQKFSHLDEGDIVCVERDKVTAFDANGQSKTLEISTITTNGDAADKAGFKHYMLKEIFEQPKVIANTLSDAFMPDNQINLSRFGFQAAEIFPRVKHVRIVACGTSYHAGLVAKYWLEQYADVACDVEIASEIRYRKAHVPSDALFVTISQSGETADTLAALRQAKALGYLATMAICNVPNSSLVREADLIFMTRAGTEMGVASTKAFTTQLTGLLMFTAALAQIKGNQDTADMIIEQLKCIPSAIEKVLALDSIIDTMSSQFAEKHHCLFLGRGVQYPIALEGALKLKEISYIHAEAYPAGELKHGPLALVDRDMPVIAVAPNDQLLEKLESNLQEVQARGGQLFVFADKEVLSHVHQDQRMLVELHSVSDVIAPIVYSVPLQLFAYYVALQKGTDVDQPRNLAKSVTVE